MDINQSMHEYDDRMQYSSALAHEIALAVLHDSPEDITASLLLDYAHALKGLVSHLADLSYSEPGHTFIHTRTQGPLVVQADEVEARVFRFDRTEVFEDDLPDDDVDRVYQAITKIATL